MQFSIFSIVLSSVVATFIGIIALIIAGCVAAMDADDLPKVRIATVIGNGLFYATLFGIGWYFHQLVTMVLAIATASMLTLIALVIIIKKHRKKRKK